MGQRLSRRFPILILGLGALLAFRAIPSARALQAVGSGFFVSCSSLLSSNAKETISKRSAQYGPVYRIESIGPKAQLKALSELRLMNFNLRDLASSKGFSREEVVKGGRKSGTRYRDPLTHQNDSKLEELARSIAAANPDILVAQEVSSLHGLAFLVSKLEEKTGFPYFYFYEEGPSSQMFQSAWIVRADLPFDFELRSNFRKTRTQEGQEVPALSRDLPMLFFNRAAQGYSKPFLALGAVHLKSKRDSSNDPGSRKKRGAEIKAAIELVRYHSSQFDQGFPFLLVGDFNGDLHVDDEFDALFNAGFGDLYDFSEAPPVSLEKRRGFAHFPQDERHQYTGEVVYNQLDVQMLRQPKKRPLRVSSVEIVPLLDKNGDPKPLPGTPQESDANSTDHTGLLSVIRPNYY